MLICLDPGVDHLWAIKAIKDAHKAGGKIKSFYSYCGGQRLPFLSSVTDELSRST